MQKAMRGASVAPSEAADKVNKKVLDVDVSKINGKTAKVNFGKYKNVTYAKLWQNDPAYVRWAAEQVNSSGTWLRLLADWNVHQGNLTWQCKDGEVVEVTATGTRDTTTRTDKVTAPETKKAKATKSATSKVKARDTKKKQVKPKAKVRATLGAVKRVALSPLKAHANKKQRVETLVFF